MHEFSSSTNALPVLVVGAGLSGTLMAIFLAKRGYPVELLEKRADPRIHTEHAGRSINMAISARGIHALQQAGIEDHVSDLYIPMYGRMIHELDGAQELQPYGQPGQAIHSISRRDLNIRLLNAAKDFPNLQIHFGVHIESIDLESRSVTYLESDAEETQTLHGRWIVGADGVNSVVRKHMLEAARLNFSQDFLDYGYKELVMPAESDGTFQMDPNALHIWPRHQYMLIALPNQDGSFTVTLFLPRSTEDGFSFRSLQTDEDVRAFFKENFPDALARIPDLEEQFFTNPIGSLVSIRCNPWHYKDAAVLIGDASHGVVPFYGQGMNAAFEDCALLDEHLEHEEALGLDVVLAHFSRSRYPHAEAIRELSLANFQEMRSDVSRSWFVWQKHLERWLARVAPDRFIPLYSMISFTNIPYANAIDRDRAQRRQIAGIALAAAVGTAAVGAWRLVGRKRKRRAS